jgi:predicted SAM-dependent methyltransferase
MRDKLIEKLSSLHCETLARSIYEILRIAGWHIIHDSLATNRRIYKNYIGNINQKKLHIGCGSNIIEGWLNADYYPKPLTVFHLDATKSFPFEDAQFEYIYSEHMIEHIPFPQGIKMISECYRVLSVKGKLRILTPDLSFLVDLCSTNKTEIQQAYIQWATDKLKYYVPFKDEAFVINNFVRDWGHTFIYNENVLRYIFEHAGFTNITRYAVNESSDEVLCNLENSTRMPEGFLQLETIALEGTKI